MRRVPHGRSRHGDRRGPEVRIRVQPRVPELSYQGSRQQQSVGGAAAALECRGKPKASLISMGSGMRLRTRLCLTWAAGMLFAADMATRAGAGEVVVGGVPWWFQGYLEAGGRGFANDPQRDGVKALGGDSLAKYYEYRDLRP